MTKVRYKTEFLTASKSWLVSLLDLDVRIEDDELVIALAKAHTLASTELGITDSKITLVEVK